MADDDVQAPPKGATPDPETAKVQAELMKTISELSKRVAQMDDVFAMVSSGGSQQTRPSAETRAQPTAPPTAASSAEFMQMANNQSQFYAPMPMFSFPPGYPAAFMPSAPAQPMTPIFLKLKPLEITRVTAKEGEFLQWVLTEAESLEREQLLNIVRARDAYIKAVQTLGDATQARRIFVGDESTSYLDGRIGQIRATMPQEPPGAVRFGVVRSPLPPARVSDATAGTGKRFACYACGGDHMVRDCPRKDEYYATVRAQAAQGGGWLGANGRPAADGVSGGLVDPKKK